jgi:pimeloyl-ACP methyl ester carboxylesterase
VNQSETIAVDGIPIETLRIPAPSVSAAEAPPATFVLLHEALGSVSHWRDFPHRLAERTRTDVLVYSRAGHGESGGEPSPRSRRHYEQQALRVLPALLERAGVRRPLLLCHSEGAAIALLYACMHPQNVCALVLESPILLLEPAAAAGMAEAERAWRTTDLRQRLGRHHRNPGAVFDAWLSIRGADCLLEAPLEAHLPPPACPILMLQGDRDEYATLRQADALRALAPRMQLRVLPETGHTPHRERADAVLEAISAFVQHLPAADASPPGRTG